MGEIAGWIAPIATIIAAMMTATNLGARITGWGFVVITLGSVCWTIVGFTSGQHNLIISNGFLIFVNAFGIWRWLGRQTVREDGGTAAKSASRKSAAPTLFTGTGIEDMKVRDAQGQTLGKAVECLIECRSGAISYVVVSSGGAGGIAEELRAVPRDDIEFGSDRLTLKIAADAFHGLAPLTGSDWPAQA